MKSIDCLGHFGMVAKPVMIHLIMVILLPNFSLLLKRIAWKIWPTALLLKNMLLVINSPIYSLIRLSKKEIGFIWCDFFHSELMPAPDDPFNSVPNIFIIACFLNSHETEDKFFGLFVYFFPTALYLLKIKNYTFSSPVCLSSVPVF